MLSHNLVGSRLTVYSWNWDWSLKLRLGGFSRFWGRRSTTGRDRPWQEMTALSLWSTWCILRRNRSTSRCVLDERQKAFFADASEDKIEFSGSYRPYLLNNWTDCLFTFSYGTGGSTSSILPYGLFRRGDVPSADPINRPVSISSFSLNFTNILFVITLV